MGKLDGGMRGSTRGIGGGTRGSTPTSLLGDFYAQLRQ